MKKRQPNTSPPLASRDELKLDILPFKHPPGFTASEFVIIAVDDHGQTFVNFPVQSPLLGLSLLSAAMDAVLKRCVSQGIKVIMPAPPIIPNHPGGRC